MRYILVLGAFLFFSGLSFSATLDVPGDFSTIQEAIDAAAEGDTVLVDPGTYVESLDFGGKAITVTSSGGAAVTTIDGNRTGRVVKFAYAEGLDTVLDGFTITNGLVSLNGGGIICYYASPTITDNIICGNQAERDGGGIFCQGTASPLISGNIIENNLASGSTFGSRGGGIACLSNYCSPPISDNVFTANASREGGAIFCDRSSPTITGNVISENHAEWDGGGISCYWEASPTVGGNTITRNSADRSGGALSCYYSSPDVDGNIITENTARYGGGIHCVDSAAVITSNTVVGNSAEYGGGFLCGQESFPILENLILAGNRAEYWGGGIYCSGDSSLNVSSSTIAANTAGEWGGGIFSHMNSSLTVKNSVLWDNAAAQGPEIWVGTTAWPSSLSISYSDVEGGQSSVHVDPRCLLMWGSGMIESDPLFVDSSVSDFHLSWLSPCINRGSDFAAPLHDIDGDPRPCMGTIDMGADEFDGTHALGADPFSISESAGGTVDFFLFGGAPNGGRNFLLLGSLSGTTPGHPLPDGLVVLPLNIDSFTWTVYRNLNTPRFQNFWGGLSWGSSTATATFDTLGPLPPGSAGLTASFAFLLVGPPWDFASNPINVKVVP